MRWRRELSPRRSGGIPSTMLALLTGADPLGASRAAGSLLLPDEQCPGRLLGAASLVHGSLSLGWALILTAALPSRRTALTGGLAGAAIAALDLGSSIVASLESAGSRCSPSSPTTSRTAPPSARSSPGAGDGTEATRQQDRERGPACGAGTGKHRAWEGRARHPGRRRHRRTCPTSGPARVFEFLSDLNNHWLLEDRFVELGGLDEHGGDGPRGGRVRLKGPLGIAREARTRVVSAQAPSSSQPGRLAGRAEIGTRTTGRVIWTTVPRPDGGSLVTLAAVVEQASPLDRTLHLLSRRWLQRTFDQTLTNLDGILAAPGTHIPEGLDIPSIPPPLWAKGRSQGPLMTPNRKRQLTTALAKYAVNPGMRKALELGVAPRGYALLETTGRRSGLPRRTPIRNGLDGDTFWIVAEHDRSAAYVRNIEANPRVRVKVGRRWRTGSAHLA